MKGKELSKENQKQSQNLPNQQAKNSINPWDATRELEQLLKLPEPVAHDRVLTWIRAGLYLITPEQVKVAIRDKVTVDKALFQHLHLGHPLVRPLARSVFRIFWSSVEYYLVDATRLYSILAANPEIQRTLDTSQGLAWLDWCCINGYTYLWNYTWAM